MNELEAKQLLRDNGVVQSIEDHRTIEEIARTIIETGSPAMRDVLVIDVIDNSQPESGIIRSIDE
jgi:hypothetical protein